MKKVIAIASGKGGTGKTTVAVNLAAVADKQVKLIDCDVEEPNCHIFLQPDIDFCETVFRPVPEVYEDNCNLCGECGSICEFNAIAVLNDSVLTFPELCHGCGGCALVCKQKAISEVGLDMGIIECGRSGNVDFVHGILKIGEAKAPPLIRAVKNYVSTSEFTIVDAPPGTSCPVIESVRGCDYVVLVTEPTPFGLHDLKLSVGMVRELNLPFGVVINRTTMHDNCVVDYCTIEGIELLLEIPEDRKIAEAYSEGNLIVNSIPEYREIFARLYSRIHSNEVNEIEQYV